MRLYWSRLLMTYFSINRNPRSLSLCIRNNSVYCQPKQIHSLSRNSNRSSNMMQTSITSFFKVKTVVKKKRDDQVQQRDRDEEEDNENRQSEDERDQDADNETDRESVGGESAKVIDLDEEDDSVEEVTTTKKKRLLDSDDDDDIPVSKNKKRYALSSTETTPVKTPVKSKTEAEAKVVEEVDDEKKTDGEKGESCKVVNQQNSTPAKPSAAQLLMAASGSLAQSPLFDTGALIKKKIASGSQALHENIGVSWFKALQSEFDKPYFKKLSAFVDEQRRTKTVFPPADQVFTWTHYHPIRETRVVVIGQDPYHGPNQAHGLSFSVQKGNAIPKSLQNIYKELQSDIPDFKHPGHGCLIGWSKQGVLMLNACLTVNRGQPNSHQGKGWETFTDATISYISKNASRNCVFLLWGRFAQQKSKLIDKRHKILTSAHPSPFSADSGFFGCKHFSQTNAFLKSQNLDEINWSAL